MIKAAIFDLDDTMVDSDPIHKEAWDLLLAKYGYSFSALPESFRSRQIGLRLIDTSKAVIAELGLDVELQPFFQERCDIFLELVKKKLQPMPGLKYSLDMLREEGLVLAIASSGTRTYINTAVEKLGIESYFHVIVAGDEVKVGKPNPEIYLTACAKLGLLPSECLVFEDATLGIASAKDAGCWCIGVNAPNTPVQDRSRADLTLGSLHEVNMGVVRSLGKQKARRGN